MMKTRGFASKAKDPRRLSVCAGGVLHAAAARWVAHALADAPGKRLRRAR
jgi:hypothetical protein